MPLAHLSDESILWEGRPARPVTYPTLAVLFLASALVSGLFHNVSIELFFFIMFGIALGGTIVIGLRLLTSHYYITDQRVVMEWGRLGHKELSLADLGEVRVRTGGFIKRRGLGFIMFLNASGKLAILFNPLKNPETVKQIALNAKSSIVSSRQ